ncbi:pleckstrin homology domain-containing family S member 1 [Megalobrama amblycephala]|uniref:pleckstrin homology domain-containing family S member 1 n=1 Tax=Megalobrama amblycephala TaxID=75352 RepID=UPI002013F660|nr:pleckstrin homology domain-containing family S member 1 [Megalobrama amblycephala]
MSGSRSGSNASHKNEAAEAEELYTGFLYKSPPSGQIKLTKSWKRRFFVLAKTNDRSHELNYYRTTERNKLIKSIAVSTITLLYVHPESHSVFEWICKTFKCSSSSVFFMKTENPANKVQREYFFIGDTSEEVDRWFNALSGVLKNIKSESKTEPQIMPEYNSSDQNPCDTEETEVDSPPPLPPRGKSASKGVPTQQGQCSQPPKNSPSATEVCEEMEKKETLDETAEDSNEDTSSGESVTDTSEGSLLYCVTEVFSKNSLTQQKSTESDKYKTHNGNCASTKQDGSDTDKSETHTLVEKEIRVSHRDLNSLIFTEETGKPCVSECQQIQDSCLFHKGDQILAVNDLLTDSVEEFHKYLRRLSKNEVKLTILRLPGSVPLHSEPC